jgi:thiamine transport system ATP-binding protein
VLVADGIEVSFGGHRAVAGASLAAATGEVVTVLGPSGCGKSTLLRVIAGLQRPDAGRILLDGVEITRLPTHKRGIGLMFQEHALFPHRDVEGNVAFGLRMQGVAAAESARRVAELLELVGLAGYQRREVETLSGGERQRVALARALAPRPRVLLLDEPLASLDRPLRDRLKEDLAHLFDALDLVIVYVTHDRSEALSLGDRVAVMRSGAVVQCATPDAVWAAPADDGVARFLGIGTFLDGRLVRPEAVHVRRSSTGNAVVESARRDGHLVVLRLLLDRGEIIEALAVGLDHPQAGDRVETTIDPNGIVDVTVRATLVPPDDPP